MKLLTDVSLYCVIVNIYIQVIPHLFSVLYNQSKRLQSLCVFPHVTFVRRNSSHLVPECKDPNKAGTSLLIPTPPKQSKLLFFSEYTIWLQVYTNG